MDPRVAILTVPSLVVLGLLVVHSARALPKARALGFWGSVLGYGIVRGLALSFVVDRGLGASFPYVIKNPLLPLFGVPMQELAGWGIVAYLGWWLGARFSRAVFAQVAWACLFLGAVSWVVEAAASAAGWWAWTVPVSHPFFINVPFIGIVDWLFVGIDFLLPFLALTAPALLGSPARYASLLAFPAHFASHALRGSVGGVPFQHAAHWALIAALFWLVMRSEATDAPFRDVGPVFRWLPVAALAIVALDAAFVALFVAQRPDLLVSLVPFAGVVAVSFLPVTSIAVERGLAWGRKRMWVALGTVAVVAAIAVTWHSAASRGEAELTRRLDAALAARDRGDLDGARRELAALASEFPGSHVPSALLGEIDYRTERLDEARKAFARALEVKPDYAKGLRYLAVIDLRQGRRERAADDAARGLAVDAGDPELQYLAARAQFVRGIAHSIDPRTPETALTLASLAFEVGDTDSAAGFLQSGLARWPGERRFFPAIVNLAVSLKNPAAAREYLALWQERFPDDAEARQMSRVLGIN